MMARATRRLWALLALAVVVSAVVALAAPASAQARTFYLYRTYFSPGYAEEGSGVSVRFYNVDSIPHRIVSDQVYGSDPWSLDITLMPRQGYTIPQPFSCSYPTCGGLAKYVFREADRSRIVYDDWYSWCSGYCGSLSVHR
jgi:hypothetical protein